MKKYNNIDDFFKEQITDFQITPSDKVWHNIENEVINTNKSNTLKTILWSVASILIIFSSVFIWLMLTTSSEQNINKITHSDILNQSNNTIIVDETTSNTEINNSNNQALISKSTNNDITKISNSSNKKIARTNKNQSITINNNLKLTSNSKNNSNSYNVGKINGTFNQVAGIVGITHKDIYNIENNCKPSIINDFQKMTVENYIEKRKKMHIYTGGSSSIAMTYYSASTDQLTWSADLAYGLKLNKYYIESGIGFQQMKEEAIIQIDYKTNDSVGYYNKVVSFEVNPDEPGTITYKTQTTTVYDSIQHQMLQSPLYKYNYITIPLKFGYKFFQKEHLSLSAETGIIYSYLTKTFVPTASYSNPDSQLLSISDNTPQRVEHNFRLHIALRVNYNITNTISMFVQPEFTSYINYIYKEPYSNHTKPYTMGIRFGILFDF